MGSALTGVYGDSGSGAGPKNGACAFAWAKPFISQGSRWVDALRHEYYDCDIESLSNDKKFDLVARRGMSSPCPVTLISSRRRYAFWRSWNHISDNRENVVMLRYVKSGAFSLTQCGSTIRVGTGQFALSKSNVPFRWESLANDLSLSEYYSVLLPLDMVHRHFPDGIPLKDSLSAPPDCRLVMPTLFSLLIEQGEDLERNVVEMLIETLLTEAETVVKGSGVPVDARKHISEKRFEEIIAYITLHLSNPDISSSAVAQGCGISSRYLCHLLKMKGTSFSDLLWEERLKHTGKWLLALDTRHYTIAEIAYMNGFKTAAHFSRLFKNYWGCSPREFRQSGGKSAVRSVGQNAAGSILDEDTLLNDCADVAFEARASRQRVHELTA